MPAVEAAGAVRNVWAKTLASYKKDLPRKDLLVVEAITSPKDVASHIEELEAKTHAGKSGAFADRVHAITGRLTQFSNVIDVMTSSNTEASLIWGSLRLLLTIVHRSSEEYVKICQSILAVSDSFPIVGLVTETFTHSELVCDHAVAFYTSVLDFWSKALCFYKRRRVFNIFRVWHDFDSEFGDLDTDMKRHGQNLEKAAAAVHMKESRTARLEQKAVSREIIEVERSAETSDRHRDIVKWLAPTNHEASYFVDDRKSSYESRHPGTCTWILDRPEFDVWMKSVPSNTVTRMLWLTGVPGVGKTVLSSFVINRCFEVSSEKPSPPILYFFFKNTDSDKNSVLAVTRSLVFQLYSLLPAKMSPEIISSRNDSGKEKALSEQGLWDLFVKHAKHLADLVIILDALDECDDVDLLLRRMKSLLQSCHAKIFVASRREGNIALVLEDYPRVLIGHEDIDADISSYVIAEIEKIPRFHGKSIQRRMISALTSGHGGMFLWAYLMVKELQELRTVRQVENALKSLPTGLEEMYKAIITRLDSTLHRAHRELAIKILTWIVGAVRPLRLAELQDILGFEIRQGRIEAHSLIDDDDDLLYSEKDIELACGALVLCRNGTLQLIHLSTKEFLTRRPDHLHSDDSRAAFYVDGQQRNPDMAILCLSYMSIHLLGVDSVTRPNLETVPRLRLRTESFHSADLITISPFMDYASVSWQAHLIDGKLSLELEEIMGQLQTLLTYKFTLLWIELCVSLHSDIIWTLERSCKEVMSWSDYAVLPTDSAFHKAIGFLWAWSNAVMLIINEYGRVIEEFPYEIHFLDFGNVLSCESAPSPAVLPTSYATAHGSDPREQMSYVRAAREQQLSVKVEPGRQLQPNLQDPSMDHRLGFVLYDSTREVLFSADAGATNDTAVLRVQERATGRRLQPIKTTLQDSNIYWDHSGLTKSSAIHMRLITATLSPDGKYLAILYGGDSGQFATSIWVIQSHLEFRNIRDRHPWARRLHCFGTYNALFVNSCLPLTVGKDGLFYCPSGQIHPEYGIQERIPTSLAWAGLCYRSLGKQAILAFAGNGQSIVRLDMSVGLIEKIGWLKTTVTGSLQLGIPANDGQQDLLYLKAVSETARFLVYETSPKEKSPVVSYLVDSLGTQQQLQAGEPRSLSTLFYFSRDEKSLVEIYDAGQHNLTHFSRWTVTEPSVEPQAETSLLIPSFRPAPPCIRPGMIDYGGQNVCMAEQDSKIVLVTWDRVLHELDLGSLTLKEGSVDPPLQSFCERDYQISSDGRRLVECYVRCPNRFDLTMSKREPDLSKTHIELVFVDLSGTADQIQRLELEYTDPDLSASHLHVITFSPDLSMMQAGSHIFDLLAPGLAPFPIPNSPLCKLGPKICPFVSFSSCNGYLIVIERKDAAAEAELTTFGLFRIHRNAGKIETLAIAALDGFVADAISGKFHPFLPLLLLTRISRERSDVKGSTLKDFGKVIEVVEIDLLELKPISVTIPKHCIFISEREYEDAIRCTEAYFSDCGSFCFLLAGCYGVLNLSSTLLGMWQAKMQIPAVWGRQTSYNGRLYQVNTRYEHTLVGLYQAIDRPHRNSLRDSPYLWRLPEHTIAVHLTPLPAHLANAQVHLLVGKNKDDLIRILFLPVKGATPEIKYLRVTLDQVLAKLEESARAAQPAIDKLFQEDKASFSRYNPARVKDDMFR